MHTPLTPKGAAGPCVLADGVSDPTVQMDACAGRFAVIQAMLAGQKTMIAIAALLSFAILEASIELHAQAALEIAARVLCSLCTGLLSFTYWIHVNPRVLRMLALRARYIQDARHLHGVIAKVTDCEADWLKLSACTGSCTLVEQQCLASC